GPIQPGPPVIKWRPRRDAYGRVTRPARIWLTRGDQPVAPPESADAILPVAGDWLAGLRIDDRIKLIDARDARRTMKVVACPDGGVWGEAEQTAYVTPGTPLHVSHHAIDDDTTSRTRWRTEVGALAPTPRAILLAPGDTLVLLRDLLPGVPAVLGLQGEV